MKKLVNAIIIIMTLILIGTISYASENVEAILTTEDQDKKLYANDSVVFTLRLDNLQDVNYGINAYKGTLKYEKEVFEPVTEADFKELHDWDGLQYNPNTGEFVIYKREGITEGEDVLQISLKVKENIKATNAEVKIVDSEVSNGKKDLEIVDEEKPKVELDIIEEQKTPGKDPEEQKPNINPGDNSNNGDNSNIEGSTNPGGNSNNGGNSNAGENSNNGENSNSGNNSNGDKTDSNKTNGNNNQTDNKAPTKLPNTGKSYIGLFLILGIELVAAANVVRYGNKNIKNEKTKTFIKIFLVAALSLQFLGTVYASTTFWANKGDLNGDGTIGDADILILISDLVSKTKIEDAEVFERADMNDDGKLTITDLSLLIKKRYKRLDYEVTIQDLKVSNYAPNKEDEIVISFKAEVSYDEKIKTITMNGQTYEPQKNAEGIYEIKVKAEKNSGVKEYKLESTRLNNGTDVKLNETVKVDVLKQKPEMENFEAVDDPDDGKSELNLSFDIVDPDNALISANYEIVKKQENNEEQEGTPIKTGEVKSGNNKINVEVEENEKYEFKLYVKYNLDTDTLEEAGRNEETTPIIKDLCLAVDYKFETPNIETYKVIKDGVINEGTSEEKREYEEKITDEFGIDEHIGLRFKFANAPTFMPKKAIINGEEYELEEDGKNTYKVLVKGIEALGEQTIKVEKIILSNNKPFDTDEEVKIKVIKKTPTISRFRANENGANKAIQMHIYVKDLDKTISDLEVKLYEIKVDEETKKETEIEIDSKNLKEQLVDKNLVRAEEAEETGDENIKDSYCINTILDTKKATLPKSYKTKIFATYALLEDNGDYKYENKILLEEKQNAVPVVNIKSVNVSNKYPEKNEDITLTYEIETNRPELKITHIMVNNLKCIATEHIDNNKKSTYSVTLSAGNKAGYLDLITREFMFEGNLTSVTENKAEQVDVLRDKPVSVNYTQKDDAANSKVTLTATIEDPDDGFKNLKVILVKNSDQEEELEEAKEISKEQIIATKEFETKNVTFEIGDLELDTKYTLISKITYDRDSNKVKDDYYVEDEEFSRRPIQLVADYDLEISNIKTYNGETQTRYIERGEEVTLSFDCTNKTAFYPTIAVINGKEYELEKQGDNYTTKAKIPFSYEYGKKDITIEELTLNNTKRLKVEKDNKTEIEIIKLRPTIENFGYAENEANNTVEVTFTVNDTEETITGGTIKVIGENGEIVKEQPFTRESKGITFEKGNGEEFEIKVTATYDLDTTEEDNHNIYRDQVLLTEDIDVSAKRLFEVKDITGISLYEAGKTEEVTNITEAQLKGNLDNYIVKVRTKGMPTFFATIENYEKTSEGKLNFILNYKNVVQYDKNGNKQSNDNKLKVTYGKIEDGVAQNKSIESLIAEIEANPSGTFKLTQDYDAATLNSATSTIITSNFSGTLDGNGHKISNLNKPLFNSLGIATIKNLVLEDINLVGANSKGSLANTATGATVENVHIRKLNMTTGADESAAIIGKLQESTITKCSSTKLHIKLNHIRVSGIAGKVIGSTISDCYVEGIIESITSTKDGVAGIVGDAGENASSPITTITNCISKIEFVNNTRAANNGGIIGLARNNRAVLTNNVSLCTGSGVNSVRGSNIDGSSSNNYELNVEESGLITNKDGKVASIEKENINKEFFLSKARFNADIWNLENTSYDNLPTLKNADPNNNKEEVEEKQTNTNLYIPEYSRISKMGGFDKNKLIAYHNLHKLMPYYDAKYLVTDAIAISTDDILNTKAIKHILPYKGEKMITYLTTSDYGEISKIKVVFEDYSVQEYSVKCEKYDQNIAIYQIPKLGISYAYDNYTINENSTMVNTLAEYIKGVNYATVLDPLTSAADSKLYSEHYNDVIKANAQKIALQILQNDDNNVLNINNSVLNNIIQNDLIDSGKINKILYGYNYYHRWYQFEIGGAKVSDIMLFEGKMYNTSMTMENLARETLTGATAPGSTGNFYASNISKYTGNASVGNFLDNIIKNIGGYEDVNDWFTEYFPTIGILAEVKLDAYPELQYRAWYQMKKYSNYLLLLTTLPKNAGYIVSGPAQLQVGAQRVYELNTATEAAQTSIKNKINAHVKLIKSHFGTLAGTFDREKWNNYCIFVTDRNVVIKGYQASPLPWLGNTVVTETCKAGTTEPFHKNFNEPINNWYNSSAAGVGSTAGWMKFGAVQGLTNFETWSHEYQHALGDKILLFQKGMRLRMEDYTQGVMEQRQSWSENTISNADVGAGYFNLVYNLNKENFVTQNLTPERINTREKLENYYKGQQDTIDLLDYISAKAFITLTPEQQAKIATRITQNGTNTTWGTITADEASTMKLTTLEALWDNKIILRPANAWGISIRGGEIITSQGANDYGFESVWTTRWYITHNPAGSSNAVANKRNLFEMLGYAGVDGFVMYGSTQSKNDLDAIQKITKAKTGTAVADWKEYKFLRYDTIEKSLKNNKYIDSDFMLEEFTKALQADANKGDANKTQSTNLRKVYFHYLKRVTNDFIADPLGGNLNEKHIKTAEELIEKINKEPYGYYVLDNDIDFSNTTATVTQTFMGTLDGNNHKIIGNTNTIFNKIKFGAVKNLTFEETNIPSNITNVGALAKSTEYSILENIKAVNLRINANGRSDLNLIAGSTAGGTTKDCKVERLTVQIKSPVDFNKIQEDPGGLFNIANDIDFTGYTASGNAVVSTIFTGTIEGNGHTISNLNNLSLFANFRGKVQNLNISDFTNTGAGRGDGDFVAAFAQESFTATFKNMKFNNITLSGRNNVAVVVGMDGRDNANSVFENISVKNANVTGTGVYVSTFVGRKFGGIIKNVFVQGTLNINSTENGGLVGAMQQGGTIENIITDVAITKSHNTYATIANSEFNGSMFGNIYATPKVNNSIAFGNMTGFTDGEGNKKVPYKFTGAAESQVTACFNKCYEVTEEIGTSRVSGNTAGRLDTVSRASLNADFYKNLGFDESIWNLNKLNSKGYPELK